MTSLAVGGRWTIKGCDLLSLETIKKLEVVKYEWYRSPRKSRGFIPASVRHFCVLKILVLVLGVLGICFDDSPKD